MFPPETFPTVQICLDRIIAEHSEFLDDGLSGGFPDWMYRRYRLGKRAGRVHDEGYCTRCHKAGSMTKDQQEYLDHQLKTHADECLPWWLPIAPIILFLGVKIGGGGSFDTCGANPRDATDEQKADGLCRHNMQMPDWMRNLE